MCLASGDTVTYQPEEPEHDSDHEPKHRKPQEEGQKVIDEREQSAE